MEQTPQRMEGAPEPFPDEPKLLLLDTCGSEASVALARGGEVLGEVQLPGRSASERLVSTLAELLHAQGWRLAELQGVAVVQGPGSFTGVRVGLSAAKAMAEGARLPLIAMTRLEILAEGVHGPALVVLPAGRDEVFWAEVLQAGLQAQGVASWDEIQARATTRGWRVVCEEGFPGKAAEEVAMQRVPVLTARSGSGLAFRRLRDGAFADPLLLDAVYLHRTEQQTLERQRGHQTRAHAAAVTR